MTARGQPSVLPVRGVFGFGRRRCSGGWAHDERGSNLVETAFVLPVLLLLLAGVVDLGRAFRDYIIITAAAREGAYFAAYFPDQITLIQDRVLQAASDAGAPLVRSNITVTQRAGVGSDRAVRVAVARRVDLILGAILGMNSLTIRSYAEMPILATE
ncbi:MAG: pilus assembly protein [Anaerolineae bacterium]|nr:pilus assembly protein [Anaerolineae bacterium]